MNNDVNKAIDLFISGCWEKVDAYYKEALSGKNVYIYGSGVYGKFLYQALSHLGYGSQIKAFINDFITEEELLFDVPVKKLDSLNIDNDKDIIVVGIQNSAKIIERLSELKLNHIASDADQNFYQDNLMYTVYKCIEVSKLGDVVGKIKDYYSGAIESDDEILALYNEKLSNDIIKLRLDFYKTGDVSYIDKIPFNPKQYFDTEYYTVSDDEVFVDCGAFDGDTIKGFIELTNDRYDRIFGLEPDSISFKKLTEATKNYHDVKLICCATGSENTKMSFSSKGTIYSSFSQNGDGDMIEVRKLDDILDGEKVTLIKMDIEGAELDTLIGAENTIRNNKPKLAICIYHKLEDIVTIPKYLHSLVPEYRFKVRHHSGTLLETVLYAEV